MQMSEMEQNRHGMLPATSHDEQARQQFVRSFKEHIVQKIHPGNRIAYEKRVKPDYERVHGHAPRDRRDVAEAMPQDPQYRMWSSLLRTSQEMMWSSAQLPVQRLLPDLIDRAKEAEGAGGTLRLNPELTIPRYHTAVDIHCQPGGYHTEFTDDDVAAGAVYDRAVFIYSMGQMGPNNSDMGDSLVAWLKEERPDFRPKRILDLGCAVGHSTVPYAKAWPEAEVHGIDVGAPMLRYAHARAEALGTKVHFSQQNAESMEFEDGSFDLIVSHILLHETSEKAIHNIVAECHRLLRDGGMMIHAETPQYEGMDPIDAFILDWDTVNNNEPYWRRSHEIDLDKLARSGGFDAAKSFRVLAPSAYQVAESRRSHVFQGGDFGGGGMWFLYGCEK